MPNYLYNGVELPALPEWDKETYPYAHLWRVQIVDAVAYCVEYSTTPVYAEDGENSYQLKYKSKGSSIRYTRYPYAPDEWKKPFETTYNEGDLCGYSVVWSNHDIYHDDGSLIIKASDPVPVGGAGWKKHDAYKPYAEPIAYRYNSVELPTLPEWDKETYPYAYIFPYSGSYRLRVFSERMYYDEYTTASGSATAAAFKNTATVIAYKITDGKWVLASSSPASVKAYDVFDPSGTRYSSMYYIWANTDILWYKDDKIHLPASDPAPVYGEYQWSGKSYYRVMGGKWVKQDEVVPVSEAMPCPDNCLTFSSAEPFTVSALAKRWDGTLEYSADNITWSEWDGKTAITSAEHDAEQRIYMRGSGNSIIAGEYVCKWALTGNNISCNGNIENLLDYETVSNGEHPIMADCCYHSLFCDCTSLVSAPELPTTTLSNQCYYEMFRGCTNLVNAPELPATTLSWQCYNGMFEGCTSLISAPKLPATTLAPNCYDEMFCGCTSLVSAPELPATTLVVGCYSGMFSHCTSLISAPKLPATTLASSCYNAMFYNCTSLVNAPELPATTLAENCYYGMFEGCTSLAIVPTLPATTLAVCCYFYMFHRCQNFKLSTTKTDEYQTEYRVPTNGTGATADYALVMMFAQTGGTFTGTPEINKTYYTSNTVV